MRVMTLPMAGKMQRPLRTKARTPPPMASKNKSGLRARGLHAGALDWHAAAAVPMPNPTTTTADRNSP